MAQSDDGMGTGAKVVLAVLGVGCVLVLLCCGGAYWWGNRMWGSLTESFTDDPNRIRAISREIADIDVPDGFEPVSGMDSDAFGTPMKMVTYTAADGISSLVLTQYDGMGDDEVMTTMADQEFDDEPLFTTDVDTVERRVFRFGSDERVFDFTTATESDDEAPMYAVSGRFPGRGGPVALYMQALGAHWDEAAVTRMIESVGGTYVRTESAPEGAGSTAADADHAIPDSQTNESSPPASVEGTPQGSVEPEI